MSITRDELSRRSKAMGAKGFVNPGGKSDTYFKDSPVAKARASQPARPKMGHPGSRHSHLKKGPGSLQKPQGPGGRQAAPARPPLQRARPLPPGGAQRHTLEQRGKLPPGALQRPPSVDRGQKEADFRKMAEAYRRRQTQRARPTSDGSMLKPRPLGRAPVSPGMANSIRKPFGGMKKPLAGAPKKSFALKKPIK